MSPAIERFVLHWGDMGASWGVNRSVAQIHALLLVSDEPLNAEEISSVLSIARSNVSNSLKELMTWDLVKRVPKKGDRRDYFEAEGDVWEMVIRVLEMRKARELDPAKAVLADCLAKARGDADASPTAVQRLTDLSELIDLMDVWHVQLKDTPKETLVPLIRMGSKAMDILKPFVRKRDAEDR